VFNRTRVRLGLPFDQDVPVGGASPTIPRATTRADFVNWWNVGQYIDDVAALARGILRHDRAGGGPTTRLAQGSAESTS
jgi:hypothetical protein